MPTVTRPYEDLVHNAKQFVTNRNWSQFHDVRSLTLAIMNELGELAEVVMWGEDASALAESEAQNRRLRVQEEMADVFLYLIHLASIVDVDLVAAASAKLSAAELKYPLAAPLS